MPLIACLFALALAIAPVGSGDGALPVASQGPATQIGATQFVVYSKRVGRNFLIKVTPPFAPIPAGQKRPVIYALDGGYEVAGPMGWVLGGSGAMTQSWIISVSYEPADYHWRETDLAHVSIVEENGATTKPGGAAFESFLTDELAPFIARRFAVDPARSYLFGHSRGGLFTATVFAERPQAFRGYIIGSPDIRHNPDVLKAVAGAAGNAEGVRVFVAAGGAEAPVVLKDETALAAALTGPGSKAIVTSRIYEGATHLGYYTRLIDDAFPWLLPPPAKGP